MQTIYWGNCACAFFMGMDKAHPNKSESN